MVVTELSTNSLKVYVRVSLKYEVVLTRDDLMLRHSLTLDDLLISLSPSTSRGGWRFERDIDIFGIELFYELYCKLLRVKPFDVSLSTPSHL